MSSTILNNIARFVFLLFFQVLVFNNINLFGYINPYPYVLFIILFPVNANKNVLLITSFALGLFLDYFLNSGGVHAIACLILAFIRPYFFKLSFGLSYEYQTVRLNDVVTPERFSFILFSVATHHFILFLVEIFSVDFIWEIGIRTVVSTLLTVIFCLLIIYLIKPNKQR